MNDKIEVNENAAVPSMTSASLENALANQTNARVTEDSINAVIKKTDYVRVGVLTIAVITLKNGFTVTGESACAHPDNYNEEIGNKIAYDNARNKIWLLEGYLLRQRLYTGN